MLRALCLVPGAVLLTWVLAMAGCTGPGGGGADPLASGAFERVDARRIRHRATGIVLIEIPAGTFTMGSPRSESRRDRDEVLHEVTIEQPYWLGETEVTAAQWRRVMEPGQGEAAASDDHPIGGVTWHRADAFVARLAEQTPGFRLPSESEWEYACRAGTSTAYAFGDDLLPSQARFDESDPYRRGGARGERPDGPVEVGRFAPNAWGLYDMHGNLWEWAADTYVYDVSAPDAAAQRAVLEGVPGAPRVMRGGAFTRGAVAARCAYRDGYPPGSREAKYGVRVAWSAP